MVEKHCETNSSKIFPPCKIVTVERGNNVDEAYFLFQFFQTVRGKDCELYSAWLSQVNDQYSVTLLV